MLILSDLHSDLHKETWDLLFQKFPSRQWLARFLASLFNLYYFFFLITTFPKIVRNERLKIDRVSKFHFLTLCQEYRRINSHIPNVSMTLILSLLDTYQWHGILLFSARNLNMEFKYFGPFTSSGITKFNHSP
jgi:hypothetical protein